jgi:hypothetical protein
VSVVSRHGVRTYVQVADHGIETNPENIDLSFHFETGGTSMRRIMTFLMLLSVAVFWAACSTADNSKATGNANVKSQNSNANANVHSNINANEHANMNMGNKNANAEKTP